MTSHPQHHHSPVDGLRALVRLYPWSVLWVLLAMALSLVITGNWLANALILGLILCVTGHCIYRLHSDHQKGDR